jgi:signal transduction histidine kinase
VLVNDVTDASRIQVGHLELRLDQANLGEIVWEAVEAQQQAAPERSIHFLPPADLSVPVYVGPPRIEQVVTNYLINALKYSRSDRPVEVGIEVEAHQARVWVRDQGCHSRSRNTSGDASIGPKESRCRVVRRLDWDWACISRA